jgi:hypothetical protein
MRKAGHPALPECSNRSTSVQLSPEKVCVNENGTYCNREVHGDLGKHFCASARESRKDPTPPRFNYREASLPAGGLRHWRGDIVAFHGEVFRFGHRDIDLFDQTCRALHTDADGGRFC